MRTPLFIVGMPRSGTTLLSALLDAHPSIAITPETHFYTRCWEAAAPASERPDDVWARLVQQPGVQDMQLTEAEIERIWSRARAADRPAPPDLLRALGTTYAERSGAEIWGEKTPDHLAHVPAMLRNFPDAAVLCIVRDPRDVCLSLRDMPWNHDSLPEAAWTWRRYAQKSLRYRDAFSEHFHIIRYEDLLEDPEAELRAVAEWVGVTFDDRMLRFHHQEGGPADTDREPWKAKMHRPVDPTNKEKWRTHMTAAERAVVEIVAGAALPAYGYPRPPHTIDPALVRDLGRLLLGAARTIIRRWWHRWRTPARSAGDHTPEWIRRRNAASDPEASNGAPDGRAS
ncbi:MAG: sulfotransferase [Salinibacter sp.]